MVAGLAVLAACSSEPRLTRPAFQRRANAECGVLKAASEEFAKAQAPTAVGDDVARYLRAGAGELKKLVEQVDKLAPPENMQNGVDELLRELQDYADGLETLADRTGKGQSFQDVLDENPKVVGRLNKGAGRATTLVAELGLIGCVLPA